ncbi:MAG: hypothetical protein K9J76_00135 [Polaromonas sp.]|nr:hypothetical protein [Polaromonas sp.]
MALRAGHYMLPELLDSQLRTLEPPQRDETDVFTVRIATSLSAARCCFCRRNMWSWVG